MTAPAGPEGLLIVDKPIGLTSHDVVARLRRVLGTRKVGHAGTLDPMATGVLVCGVGRATRLLGLLALHDKEYLATVRFGIATHSEDATGEVVSAIGSTLSDADVEGALAPLRGSIRQRPSAVSAIKVDGRRAHERVRAGEDVVLEARPVEVAVLEAGPVRHLDADGVAVTDVDVRVVCSSGTYVRALARDAGESLGVGAHLTALRRTRSGRYRVEEGQSLDALMTDPPEVPRLLSITEAACGEFPVLQLDDAQDALVKVGARIEVSSPDAGPLAVLSPSGPLRAISDVVGGRLVHRMVLPE